MLEQIHYALHGPRSVVYENLPNSVTALLQERDALCKIAKAAEAENARLRAALRLAWDSMEGWAPITLLQRIKAVLDPPAETDQKEP